MDYLKSIKSLQKGTNKIRKRMTFFMKNHSLKDKTVPDFNSFTEFILTEIQMRELIHQPLENLFQNNSNQNNDI